MKTPERLNAALDAAEQANQAQPVEVPTWVQGMFAPLALVALSVAEKPLSAQELWDRIKAEMPRISGDLERTGAHVHLVQQIMGGAVHMVEQKEGHYMVANQSARETIQGQKGAADLVQQYREDVEQIKQAANKTEGGGGTKQGA